MAKKSLHQLLDEGYEIFDTCYGDASRIVNAAKDKGYTDIKTRQVRTDTPGLKMFMVLAKKQRPIPGPGTRAGLSE